LAVENVDFRPFRGRKGIEGGRLLRQTSSRQWAAPDRGHVPTSPRTCSGLHAHIGCYVSAPRWTHLLAAGKRHRFACCCSALKVDLKVLGMTSLSAESEHAKLRRRLRNSGRKGIQRGHCSASCSESPVARPDKRRGPGYSLATGSFRGANDAAESGQVGGSRSWRSSTAKYGTRIV
jgi:hypothetical protein